METQVPLKSPKESFRKTSFLLGLRKNEYFVFAAFKDNLIAVKQSLMSTSVLFTTGKIGVGILGLIWS